MQGDPIRLCIVTPNHSAGAAGGAEFQIDLLIERLLEQGRFDVSYVARTVNTSFKPEGYRIVRIGTGHRMPKFGYTTDAIALVRSLKNLRPQVIYQRVACGYSGICAWYARTYDARLVWHVAHETDLTLQPPDPGRNPVRRFLERESIRYCIRHADHVIAQTEYQASLLQSLHGRSATAVVPNWHPQPPEAAFAREPDPTGPCTVLWVANLKPWKRPELFVQLARDLACLESVRFVMVGAPAGGSGDRAWSHELSRAIAATPNLAFVGPRTQSEVNELMAGAHVFVNTSLSEGFPNTFVQAWQRAVPVVSIDVDPDGVLEREKIGMRAGTGPALADAIRALVLNPALRHEYGQRARDYARRRHSLRNIDTLADLFETCASQVSAARILGASTRQS